MLNKLIKHTLKQGIQLSYGDGSFIYWKDKFPINQPKRIMLQTTDNEEHMLWDLLHELGHAEVRRDWKDYKANYPAAYLGEREWMINGATKYKRRQAYKIDLIREEVAAWDAGVDLARKLNIDLRVEAYRAYGSKALATYIKYYGKQLSN